MELGSSLRTPRNGPLEYPLAWWARLLYGASNLAGAGIYGLVLTALGWGLLPAGPVGWVVLGLIAAWAVTMLVAYMALFTPVVVAAAGFRVRVLWWWTEVPWRDVVRMQHFAFPFDLVYVRRRWPFRRLLWGPLFFLPNEPVALVLGLERRSELFWEIWRRASEAQGRPVPVAGARPPP